MKRVTRSISPPALIPPEKLRKYASGVFTGTESVTPESRTINATSTMKQHDDEETSSSLKVISWNCDGLTKYLCHLPTSMDAFVKRKESALTEDSGFLANFLKKHKPDIMCFQEVHLWSSEMKQIEKKLRIDAPGYLHHACLPVGKAGRRKAGVLTLYRETLEPKSTSTVSWDEEGRVSVITLPKLKIYNVYCLNSSENPYKDPVSGEVRGLRSERKREFDSLLAKEMHKDVEAGMDVLLLGDLNISRYKIDALGGHLRTAHPHDLNRAHFNSLFEPFRDIIRERYPTGAKFTWFSRAGDAWTGNNDKARVDLIIGSAGLDVLEADTMEDVADRGQSDHGPLFVTLRRAASLED